MTEGFLVVPAVIYTDTFLGPGLVVSVRVESCEFAELSVGQMGR